MSLASRARERARLIASASAADLWLAYQRNHLTWGEFRAREREMLAEWLKTNPSHVETNYVRDPYGRICQPPRLFATAFDGEQVAIGEPVNRDLTSSWESVPLVAS